MQAGASGRDTRTSGRGCDGVRVIRRSRSAAQGRSRVEEAVRTGGAVARARGGGRDKV